jgi:hypothetical protein
LKNAWLLVNYPALAKTTILIEIQVFNCEKQEVPFLFFGNIWFHYARAWSVFKAGFCRRSSQ